MGEGFAFHLMSVLFSVFLIVELRLGPLQLLLMGTVLEGCRTCCSRCRPASWPTP